MSAVTDVGRAARDARRARLRAEVEAKYGPPIDGPTPAAGISDLTIGWTAWERGLGGDLPARGGVVVDRWAVADEDGEAHDHYLLVRHDRGRLVYVTLAAAQLAAGSVTRPNSLVVRGICRTAARTIADRKRADDRQDLELWSLGVRLTKAIT